MPASQANDLRSVPPRRWSEEVGGIKWLPRIIDKARAAMNGTLGDYLYGQSPMDRGLLRALGLSYKEFTNIVRRAADDDQVLSMLRDRVPEGVDLAKRWSDRLARRHRLVLFLIDLDDGYAGGWEVLRPVLRFCLRFYARYLRYNWPSKAALIGLEIESQRSGDRAQAARGAEEEPYTWFSAQTVDVSWKALLSVLLIILISGYVLAFLQRIWTIFLIIVMAIFFAYLIYPVVRWLNRRLPLIVSILIVYAVIAAIVAVGLNYLIPAISNEVTTLSRNWPEIQSKLTASVQNPHSKLFVHLPPALRDQIARLPQAVTTWMQTHGMAAAGNAIMVLIGTVAIIGACIAVPVLAAYLLYDSETIKRFFMGFVPSRRREKTLELLSELEQVVGGFIRGQLLVGASVGTLIAVGLMLVGEPYAILIGVAAGALDLIPYIGPVIAAIPAFTIAFVSGGLHLVVLVAIVFVLANQIEGHVIAPNIISRTIQLSPSAVVIAILIGGELDGVLGMFMAVPVAGIIRVLLLHVIPGSVSRDEARPVLTKDPHERTEEAAAS
ncbi:MAG TPA: AI-2E family transporter [Candidatus Baltobacteraceae bacterium]|nr:AI-2E family transporter [Candidatus Baltobacteraceae bacterium]